MENEKVDEKALCSRLASRVEELEKGLRDVLEQCFVNDRGRQWCFRTHNGIAMGMNRRKEKAVKQADKLLAGAHAKEK